MKTCLPYLFFILLFTCCNSGKVNKAELLNYLSNSTHGTFKELDVLGYRYRVSYRPASLVAEQELRRAPHLNIDSLKKTMAGRLYFVLALSRDSAELFGRMNDSYAALLEKVCFQLQNYVLLKNKNNDKAYYLADFIYPRMYSSTGSTSVLLCFNDSTMSSADYTVEVKDFLNESDEALRFDFLKSDLEKIPELKF